MFMGLVSVSISIDLGNDEYEMVKDFTVPLGVTVEQIEEMLQIHLSNLGQELNGMDKDGSV